MDGRRAWLLEALLERGRTIQRRASRLSGRGAGPVGVTGVARLEMLCRQLLSGRGEASGLKLARDVLAGYAGLDAGDRRAFFTMLVDCFSPDWNVARAAWRRHEGDATRASFQALGRALEPPRQELFRRLNRAQGGTQALVQMRSDLLATIGEAPEIGVVDDDLSHLLRSWFNRGFLVMERIGWSTPADLLERIIRYEAVHHIGGWEELRRRLQPPDRRCYAFFHPALAHDPLIFVEVALTSAVPDSIDSLLAPERSAIAPETATTAVFYSISNCQPGLQGISFGNFLIKQVVEELLRELPNLLTFVTLSPVPGFRRWLTVRSRDTTPDASVAGRLAAGDIPEGEAERTALAANVMPLAAEYLLDAKDDGARPLDPVARFHLGNGARLERLCWPADLSPTGIAGSAGLMVNYLYDLERVEANHEAYANERAIVASDAVRRLRRARRGSKKEAVHVG